TATAPATACTRVNNLYSPHLRRGSGRSTARRWAVDPVRPRAASYVPARTAAPSPSEGSSRRSAEVLGDEPGHDAGAEGHHREAAAGVGGAADQVEAAPGPAVAGAQEGREPSPAGGAVDGAAPGAVAVAQVRGGEDVGEAEPSRQVVAAPGELFQDQIAVRADADRPAPGVAGGHVDQDRPVLRPRRGLGAVVDRGAADVD